MARHDGALLPQRDVFDRLARYKTQRGLASWEQAVARLLDGVEENIS
jgi:hypothetical protein